MQRTLSGETGLKLQEGKSHLGKIDGLPDDFGFGKGLSFSTDGCADQECSCIYCKCQKGFSGNANYRFEKPLILRPEETPLVLCDHCGHDCMNNKVKLKVSDAALLVRLSDQDDHIDITNFCPNNSEGSKFFQLDLESLFPLRDQHSEVQIRCRQLTDNERSIQQPLAPPTELMEEVTVQEAPAAAVITKVKEFEKQVMDIATEVTHVTELIEGAVTLDDLAKAKIAATKVKNEWITRQAAQSAAAAQLHIDLDTCSQQIAKLEPAIARKQAHIDKVRVAASEMHQLVVKGFARLKAAFLKKIGVNTSNSAAAGLAAMAIQAQAKRGGAVGGGGGMPETFRKLHEKALKDVESRMAECEVATKEVAALKAKVTSLLDQMKNSSTSLKEQLELIAQVEATVQELDQSIAEAQAAIEEDGI